MFVAQQPAADFLTKELLQQLGSSFWIGLDRIRNQRDQPLDILSVTAHVYSSAEPAVLVAGPLTLAVEPSDTQPQLQQAGYLLQTGPGLPITVADIYRVVYAIRLRTGEVPLLQQTFVLRENPFGALRVVEVSCCDTVPCSVEVSPSSLDLDFVAGTGSITVTASNSSLIPYVSNQSWATVTGPTDTSGTATITVTENDGAERVALVTICGEIITVTQAGFGPPLAGLLHWYKADADVFSDAGTTPATNTDPVEQWNDQVVATANNLLQATLGNRPLFKTAQKNSLPAVSFDGVDDFIQWTSNGTVTQVPNGYTMFLVYKLVTWTSDHVIFGWSGSSPGYIGCAWAGAGGVTPEGGVGIGSHIRTNQLDAALNLTPGSYEILSLVAGPSVGTFRVNGGADNSTSFGFPDLASTKFALANISAGAGLPATVDVAEVLIYDSSLDTTDVDTVLTYLNEKWAVY